MTLGNDFHFRISTEGKTYEFDLLAAQTGSARYSIIPKNRADTPTIIMLLQRAFEEKPSTLEELSRELKHIPSVTHVSAHPISKTHRVGIQNLQTVEAAALTARELEKQPKATPLEPSSVTSVPSIAESRAFQNSSLPKSVLFYLLQLEQSPAFSGVAMITYGEDEPITIVSTGSSTIAPTFDAETPFNIMSVGKTFTAVAIKQLEERGLVDLDQPLAESGYLQESDYVLEGSDPQYLTDMCPSEKQTKAVAEAVDAFKQNPKITLRQLLTHTSGLCQTPEGLRFDPEATGKFAYSNYGYQLLARVVKNRSDASSFVEYVQNNIFTNPHNSSEIIMPGALQYSKKPPESEPTPHTFFMGALTSSGLPKEAARVPSPDGNGCWSMTAQDLTHFAQAFAENRYFQSPGTTKAMLKPKVQIHPEETFVKQGTGFVLSPGNPPAFFHQGGYYGRSAVVCQVQGEKPLTISGLCNSNEAGNFWADLVRLMRNDVVPEPLDYTRELATKSKSTFAWLDALNESYSKADIKKYIDEVGPPFQAFHEIPMMANILRENKPALSEILDKILEEMKD